MKDGTMVIAGRAQRQLDSLSCPAAGRHVAKPPEESLRERGTPFSGMGDDVYIAKLNPDGKGFSWIWTMEQHRDPPTRLYEGKGGEVVFRQTTGLWRISSDGSKLRDYKGTPLEKKQTYLKGIGDLDGSVIVGGTWMSSTGREPYKQPWMQVYDSEGNHHASYYGMTGPLVGHDDFRLVSDSSVGMMIQTPNGRYAMAGWSDGGNTVFSKHPIDIESPAAGTGLPISIWGAGALSACSLVTFDPRDPAKASSSIWLSMLQWVPNSIYVKGLQSMQDGSLVLFGDSGSFLIQTTQKHCRATHHYAMTGGKPGPLPLKYRFAENGWPVYQGLGGAGNYLAVLSPELDALQWSSIMPNCEHTGTAAVSGGLVAVARCTGEDAQDGRTPAVMPYDIADWYNLIRRGVESAKGKPSQVQRIWTRIPAEERQKAEAWLKEANPKQSPPEVLQGALRRCLEDIVFGARDLYDPALWPQPDLEADQVALLQQASLSPDALGPINRRLMEQALPEHLFPLPRSNRLRSMAGAQAAFGGGSLDGYIYLLRAPKEKLDLSKKPPHPDAPLAATGVKINSAVAVKGTFGKSFQGTIAPALSQETRKKEGMPGFCNTYVICRSPGRLRPLFMHGAAEQGNWKLDYERDGIRKDAEEITLKASGSFQLKFVFDAECAADVVDFSAREWLKEGTPPLIEIKDLKDWKTLDKNALILFDPKRGRLGTVDAPFGAEFSVKGTVGITALGKTQEFKDLPMKIVIKDRDARWSTRFEMMIQVPPGSLGLSTDVPVNMKVVHIAYSPAPGPSVGGKGGKINLDPGAMLGD
jgi:hypothetical protein